MFNATDSLHRPRRRSARDRDRCVRESVRARLWVLRRRIRGQLAIEQGAANESVCDDGKIAVATPRRSQHRVPGSVDASVELRPGLPGWRREIGSERIALYIRIGCAPEVAEIPLVKQRLEFQRRATLGDHDAGGLVRTLEIAREHQPKRMVA